MENLKATSENGKSRSPSPSPDQPVAAEAKPADVGDKSTSPGTSQAHEDAEQAQDNTVQAEESAVQAPDANGWTWHYDQEGRIYFYNHQTGLSQWNNPYELIAPASGAEVAATLEMKPREETYKKYVGQRDRLTATLGFENPTYSADSLDYNEPKDERPKYISSRDGNYQDWLAKHPESSKKSEERNPIAGMSNEEIRAYLFNRQAMFNHQTAGTAKPAESSSRPARDYSEATRARNQMSHFFDYDSFMASQDGKSLKEQRRKKKLTKQEVQEYRVAKKEKKEKKTRDWLGRA